MAGPSETGRFVIDGNGAEGVLIESPTTGIISNIISGNASHGVRITGRLATRNFLEGNLIGAPPSGGFLYGAGDTGNGGDGVRIENAPSNRVGGPNRDLGGVTADRDRGNIISANEGAGVRILGATATGNVLLYNLIGLTGDGNAPLGNSGEGVAIYSPGNTVGPGNAISANLRGILLSGPLANHNMVRDNLIGTDRENINIIGGWSDIGNAREGIRIEAGATSNVVIGSITDAGAGSQIISGNNVGVAIVGPTTTGNLVARQLHRHRRPGNE